MDKYKGNRYYPHGLTKPLEAGHRRWSLCLGSLQDADQVVEEQPHMKTFGNSYSTKKEKGKVFQMCCVWLVVIHVMAAVQ